MLVYINNAAVVVEGPQSLVEMFGLDSLSQEEFEDLAGKHICVDPYAEDIHNERVLMWAETADDLDRDYAESCADI